MIPIYRWHRYLGLTTVLFLVLLSVTGILLNHTEELKLAKRYVQSKWILNLYGIKTPTISAAYPVANGVIWISSIGDQLFLNQQRIPGNYENLRGVANIEQGFIAVLIEEQILLITPESEIIERLTPTEGLPTGISLLGLTKNKQLIAQTPSGLYKPDDDFMTWEKLPDNPKLQWIKPQSPPAKLQDALITQATEQIIPVERLLLDLHSGRLFGIWGVYFMDLVAILILILAPTGFIIWLQRKRRYK